MHTMTLIKWDPFQEIERAFGEDVLLPVMPAFRMADIAVDVYETDKDVVVEAMLPGFKPENVNVELEENRLTISAHREEKQEAREENYWKKEIKRGHFLRTITLPKAVMADKTQASYQEGLLKVTIPKAHEEKAKKVKVQVQQ